MFGLFFLIMSLTFFTIYEDNSDDFPKRWFTPWIFPGILMILLGVIGILVLVAFTLSSLPFYG